MSQLKVQPFSVVHSFCRKCFASFLWNSVYEVNCKINQLVITTTLEEERLLLLSSYGFPEKETAVSLETLGGPLTFMNYLEVSYIKV